MVSIKQIKKKKKEEEGNGGGGVPCAEIMYYKKLRILTCILLTRTGIGRKMFTDYEIVCMVSNLFLD